MKKQLRYWIIVASRDHALRGVQGGFCQACHGKKGPMEKMNVGDGVIIYSPREEYEGEEKCQKFTALGTVADEKLYQVEMFTGFFPFRRNIAFHPCTEIPIAPLLNFLSFTAGVTSWGLPFRRGFFEITQGDFELISKGMLRS